MRRSPDWKQPTPRMQLVTMVAAVQGDLSNMASGIQNEQQLPRCEAILEAVQEIIRQMPEGTWDPVEDFPPE